ncbi:hypothetical protein LEMLEM_LOCUS14605 [Lemmus lemmus]
MATLTPPHHVHDSWWVTIPQGQQEWQLFPEDLLCGSARPPH